MSDRRLSLGLALCALTLAACGGGSSGALDAGSTPTPIASATATPSPTAVAHKSQKPSAAAVRTTAAPTHVATTAPPSPRTSTSIQPTVAKTSPKPTPKPSSTAPTACPNNSSSASVAMVDSGASYAFSPTSVTVDCGGVVKVSNNSTNTHNMSPSKGGFTGTSDLAPTMTANVRFSYRGTYGFYCSIHPYMTGSVKVL